MDARRRISRGKVRRWKDVITYLISKYSLENVVERNLIAEKVIEKCNKLDLDVLGNEILTIWINNGADTKQKWVLALISAAKMLNLTEEDLADIIIPDLGFDNRGERVFEYGSRSFTVTLELDFSLKIADDNGKAIKTLPKPNKSDNELKAKEASAEFKILKKQIKTIVSTQTLRLEMALSVNRLWKKKDWEKLFVKNPIMHNFSLGLVWGLYVDGELKDTFRYMEDGTFNTKDEEEYELSEDALIGLVHTLEIEGETLENWSQQFEDYEIVQPFPQLQRKVYRMTEKEKEMKAIERFAANWRLER